MLRGYQRLARGGTMASASSLASILMYALCAGAVTKRSIALS